MEIDIKKLLESNVQALVDIPEKVVIEEHASDYITIYRLNVDPSDIGKVIGANGSIAKSLRRILGAIGGKIKKKLILDIIQKKDR